MKTHKPKTPERRTVHVKLDGADFKKLELLVHETRSNRNVVMRMALLDYWTSQKAVKRLARREI